MLVRLFLVALATFLINLPCGFWRQGARKYSFSWILAIHLPVPFVVLMRLRSGLGFTWFTFPAVIGAYLAGQYIGARWRKSRSQMVVSQSSQGPS